MPQEAPRPVCQSQRTGRGASWGIPHGRKPYILSLPKKETSRFASTHPTDSHVSVFRKPRGQAQGMGRHTRRIWIFSPYNGYTPPGRSADLKYRLELYNSSLYLYISRLEIESRTDLEDSALLAALLMRGDDLLACLANRQERLCSQTLHIRQHARTERSFLFLPAQSAFYLLQQACLPCCLSPSRHHRPPRCFGKSRPHRCQRTAEPAVSLKRDGRLSHFLKNKGRTYYQAKSGY